MQKEEYALREAMQRIKPELENAWLQRDYLAYLKLTATLAAYVNNFLDNVKVLKC